MIISLAFGLVVGYYVKATKADEKVINSVKQITNK